MTLEEFYKRFDFNSDASGSIIGRGGFGVVYKAFDKVRKRFVAIKRSEVGQFAKFELMREVEIANEIDPHPNILRYENVFRISDYLGTYDFAVMKYYPEGNLETVLRKNQLSEVEKKQILNS
jgi:eukaryotic-like serine/threonine-protein kinase